MPQARVYHLTKALEGPLKGTLIVYAYVANLARSLDGRDLDLGDSSWIRRRRPSASVLKGGCVGDRSG